MASEIKVISEDARSAGTADQVVWINGVLANENEARVSPFDHGLTVGDGVFETLCAYEGKVFAMRRHHERLAKGCAAMGLELPSREALLEAISGVLGANGLRDARVRITVTGGRSPLGSEKGSERSTVLVAAAQRTAWDPAAKVVTVPFTRNETGALTGLKTTSYGENVLALVHAKARGGAEAIFGNTKGRLCEGTGSNIFIVRDASVMTPPLSSGCLAGVTRALALELCAEEGIPVKEEDMPLKVLEEVEEAFLTGTTREIQPIESVDGRVLERVPGEITARLREAFRELVGRDLDP